MQCVPTLSFNSYFSNNPAWLRRISVLTRSSNNIVTLYNIPYIRRIMVIISDLGKLFIQFIQFHLWLRFDDYCSSTYFLKLFKIDCHPNLCCSTGYTCSASNTSTISVLSPTSVNVISTLRSSPRV